MKLYAILFTAFCCVAVPSVCHALDVIFAVNAGGESLTDSNGIRYRRDFLTEGVASDYGRSLDIKRANAQDKIIYQTERYATETFGYSIPVPTVDGDYVLWLKFSEVWFNAPNMKKFDVALNGQIVVSSLDIFAEAGRGIAHDELVAFKIRHGNEVLVDGKSLPFNGEIRVDFVKTEYDNPKVNAIVVVRGTVDQVPQLPAYVKPVEEELDDDEAEKDSEENAAADEEQDDEDAEAMMARKVKKQLGKKLYGDEADEADEANARRAAQRKKPAAAEPTPVITDPYASDETSYILPLLFTVGAFIPLLFCLCKL